MNEGRVINKKSVLEGMSFGDRVAESEAAELSSYFVETEEWRRVFAGQIDVVFGPKGSGKSALYSLLVSRAKELSARRVVFIPAENPRGAPAFRELAADPPAGEEQFKGMWKLYFLSLVCSFFRDQKIVDSQQITKPLEDAGLIVQAASRNQLLKGVVTFIKNLFSVSSAEPGVKLDPVSGMPAALTCKLTFGTVTAAEQAQGLISIDDLLERCDQLLEKEQLSVWLGLDRLDVAFDENASLETNALRALFKVYNDFQSANRISLKVFLRSDIWNRITSTGFREASHITKNHNISWSQDSLMNLVIRRILKNADIPNSYGVDASEVLSSIDKQYQLFYRIFPKQVHVGKKQSDTFDWLITRTKDGTGQNAPREVIHFLNTARDKQLDSFSIGKDPPEGENLFSRAVLKSSLGPVSQTRLTSTLFAEHAELKPWIEKLRGGKATHSLESLCNIWKVPTEGAAEMCQELVDIGLFEARGQRTAQTFWIPFLYRDALELTQGSAEEE